MATKKRKAGLSFIREGSWRGVPNYECTRCPFASTDKDRAVEHYLKRHGVAQPQTKPGASGSSTHDD